MEKSLNLAQVGKFVISLVFGLVFVAGMSIPLGPLPPLGDLLDPTGGGLWEVGTTANHPTYLEKTFGGLNATVTIYRDKMGIPHVYADTDSDLFFAMPVVGLLGKRIPISAIEALLFLIALRKVWAKATHFHPPGKILSISLMSIGGNKLITEPFKQARDSYIFSAILIVLGLGFFYKVTKRNFLEDFKNILLFPVRFVTDSDYRHLSLVSIKKSWYNQKLSLVFAFKNLATKIRRLNVRFSHKNSKYY